MIDTIIFDAEGVAIDTEKIWDKAQEEFLYRRGLRYDRERIKHLLSGRSITEGTRILQQEYCIPGDVEELEKERAHLVESLMEREAEFMEGFIEFFERCTHHFKTCVATAMDMRFFDCLDRRLSLSRLFRGKIFSLADVGFCSKPNPDLFLYAAKRLNSQAEECVVIEDAPLGIEAAKKAGMICIALATTFTRDKLRDAEIIMDSFSEINMEELFLR